MSFILYYSNYCENSRNLLQIISNKGEVKNEIHFISIDNRETIENKIYVILKNQEKIMLPKNIDKVPALLLLKKANQVIFGEEILNYLNKYFKKEKQVEDPEAFNFNDINSYGVNSDNFSFLDQNIESMSAKGNGGLRQIRNNAVLDYLDNIETPVDEYTPNKIGDSSLEKLQQERATQLK